MQAIISRSKPMGSITPPASKSMMQRACAAALLHTGKTIINNYGTSDDDKAALQIIQNLGAHVRHSKDSIEITSHGINPVSDTIHCGESGLSARMFIPIAALYHQPITITGEGSLMNRPMDALTTILPQLGVLVISNNAMLPVTVKGPMHVADIEIDGAMSSQFLTGMLMAYAFAAKEKTTISVKNLNSKPYVDMTVDMLRQYGKRIEHDNYTSFTIVPQAALHDDISITLEADMSAAANFVVANALTGGGIEITGLNENSLQADKAIMQVVNPKRNAFVFDATDSPDTIPLLAVYAGACNGQSKIGGMSRLVHKESNRAESTVALLGKLGVSFVLDGDVLTVTGIQHFNSCEADSYNDHRIAMAAAIAALYADGDVVINNAEAVAKSYPHFFKDLAALGVKCNLKYE
ncbi:3-phosphoshikimate 1-carboxyvinyltransferase [Chitinophagaceae bacterium IBVUCB1]|nr:3-phosphoshikimate 1-carboxyvinyltransferase [Chitinophagaceae bacterium IBVUCB1]